MKLRKIFFRVVCYKYSDDGLFFLHETMLRWFAYKCINVILDVYIIILLVFIIFFFKIWWYYISFMI